MPRTLIRGDDYAIRQPLYRYAFVDDTSAPMNLSGCSVFTTYKIAPTDPNTDAEDTEAPIKHHIKIDSDGNVIESQGLVLETVAEDGTILEQLTSDESKSLPLATPLKSDVQLIDANGEIFTWIMEEFITTIDGYTNRES